LPESVSFCASGDLIDCLKLFKVPLLGFGWWDVAD
jgi:hypothetical protein